MHHFDGIEGEELCERQQLGAVFRLLHRGRRPLAGGGTACSQRVVDLSGSDRFAVALVGRERLALQLGLERRGRSTGGAQSERRGGKTQTRKPFHGRSPSARRPATNATAAPPGGRSARRR